MNPDSDKRDDSLNNNLDSQSAPNVFSKGMNPSDASQVASQQVNNFQPQPQPEQPYAPVAPISQTVFSGQQSASNNQPSQPGLAPGYPGPAPSGSKKKKIIIGSSVIAVLIALVAVYIFAFYLPNQPDNIFKSGISRTGKATEKIVNEALEKEKIDSLSKAEVSGSLEVKGNGADYSGSFSSKFDNKNSDSNIKYNAEGSEISAQIIAKLPDSKLYPDVYFKINGLSAIGLGEFMPELVKYEDKWIHASSDYLAQNIPAQEETEENIEVNKDDIAELVKIANSTTKEYLFSVEPDKALIENKGYVGTEKLDNDITANHYNVALNVENSKKYCTALVERIMSSEAYKRLPTINKDNIDKDKADAVKNCQETSEDEFADDNKFDLWIDKKTKLIHKARFTEKDKPGEYFEIGQNYKSGDDIPLFMIVHSDEDSLDIKVNLDMNMKNTTAKGSVDASYGADNEKYSIKGHLEFKPLSGEVNPESPTNTVPIDEILSLFGLDPSMFQQDAATQIEGDSLDSGEDVFLN